MPHNLKYILKAILYKNGMIRQAILFYHVCSELMVERMKESLSHNSQGTPLNVMGHFPCSHAVCQCVYHEMESTCV